MVGISVAKPKKAIGCQFTMTFIFEALKKVVVCGLVTAASALPLGVTTAAESNQHSKVTQKTAPISQETPLKRGVTPESFRGLFLRPDVAKQLPDAFWDNGKKFAEIVKQYASKGDYWDSIVYGGIPPIAQTKGYPSIFHSGGVMSVNKFAEYVNFVALNGDPRLTAAGKPNAIYPKIIVGVVTPAEGGEADASWRTSTTEAKKVALEVEQKLGASHGACVFEIVRIVANEGDTILYGGLNKDEVEVPLKGAFIVTVPSRVVSGIVYDAAHLRNKLEEIFLENHHVLTRKEYLDRLEERMSQLRGRIKDIDNIQHFLEGKTNADFK